MEPSTSTLTGILAGGGIGFLIAFGMFALRRFFWKGALGLGWAAVVLGGYAVLMVGALMVRGQSQGGDAAMNTLIFLVGAVVGVGLWAGVTGALALFQGVRMRHKFLPSALACLPDLALVAGAFWAFQTFVSTPIERRTTETGWQQELAYRNRLKAVKERIPEQYREITSAQLNEFARQQSLAAKEGRSLNPLVPRDVENQIRNYENEVFMKPRPIPDRSGYTRARQLRSSFTTALAASWLVFVVIASLLVRPAKT